MVRPLTLFVTFSTLTLSRCGADIPDASAENARNGGAVAVLLCVCTEWCAGVCVCGACSTQSLADSTPNIANTPLCMMYKTQCSWYSESMPTNRFTWKPQDIRYNAEGIS